jgi:hypothetical protein
LKTPEKLIKNTFPMPFSRWKTEGTLALLEGKLTKGETVVIYVMSTPPLTLKKP